MATLENIYDFPTKEELNRRISLNIRKYRLLKGITQEQLAADIGKSYDFTRKLEFTKGEKSCSKETLYRIAIVLNVSVAKLYDEVE